MKKIIWLLMVAICVGAIKLAAMEFCAGAGAGPVCQNFRYELTRLPKDVQYRILSYISCMKLLSPEMHAIWKSMVTKIKFNQNSLPTYIMNKLATTNLVKRIDLGGNRNLLEVLYQALAAGYVPLLQELNLKNTSILAGLVRDILALRPNLTELNLYGCPFSAAGLVAALNANNGNQLQKLDFGYTQINADQMRFILRSCPNIVELNLESCREVVAAVVELLARCCTGLKVLDLTCTYIKADQIQLILENCYSLVRLNLHGCRDSVAGVVAALPTDSNSQLEWLDLSFTNVTFDQIKAILARCPKLTTLNLECCENGFAGLVAALINDSHGSQLQVLNVGSTDATAEQVKTIFEQCLNLKKLSLSACAESFFEMQPDRWYPLQSLDLSYTKASEADLKKILIKLPNLTELNIRHCIGSVAGLVATLAVESRPLLQKLNLALTQATADQVQQILELCPNLTELNLERSRGSAARLVAALAAGHGSQLQVLDLRGTGTTAGQLQAIEGFLPACEILY